jgi:hypothetical protein
MQIDKNILSILNNATINGDQLILNGQLDRPTYVKVNKVLEACGATWNKKLKVHLFADGAEKRIDEILSTGEVEVPKDEFNFFPTPAKIVDLMLAKVALAGKTVLEPSAGQGAIALKAKELGANVHCYELMDANFEKLVKDFPLSIKADFLTITPSPLFDVVLMNPPFLKQNDIKHVSHALMFLKPGGTLVAIMGASFTFRTDTRTQVFNELLERFGAVVEHLPEKSFKESGTLVNTVMVTIKL